MKNKTVIVVCLIMISILVLAACGGQAASSITGLWYEETGYGGTLELKSNGTCTQNVMGITLNGNYTFDESKSQGEITVEFWGEKTTSSFTAQDDKLLIDGMTYTKTKVEQKSMEDAFGDAFSELENFNFEDLMD